MTKDRRAQKSEFFTLVRPPGIRVSGFRVEGLGPRALQEQPPFDSGAGLCNSHSSTQSSCEVSEETKLCRDSVPGFTNSRICLPTVACTTRLLEKCKLAIEQN